MHIYSKQFNVLLIFILFASTSFRVVAAGSSTINQTTYISVKDSTRIGYIDNKLANAKQLSSSPDVHFNLGMLQKNITLSSIKSKKKNQITVTNNHELYNWHNNRLSRVTEHGRQVYNIVSNLNNLNEPQFFLNKGVVLQHNSQSSIIDSPTDYSYNAYNLQSSTNIHKSIKFKKNISLLRKNNANLFIPIKPIVNFQKAKIKPIYSTQLPTITTPLTTTTHIVTAVSTSTIYGGHQVTFMYQQGKWLAHIKQRLAIGYRYLILPIYGEFGFSIERLLNNVPDRQKEYIHVHFPTTYSDNKAINYVYIGKLKSQDGSIKVDVQESINNLTAAYYFINPNIYLRSDTLQAWKAMLIEIGNILARIKINLNVFTIEPNPENIRTKLEQVIYKFLHKQVRLENYPMVYNKLLKEISRQLGLTYKGFDSRSSNTHKSYSVDLQVSLQKIPPLLMELNKVKAVAKNNLASFDLNKLFDSLKISVSVKESPKSSAGNLLTSIEYFSQIQNQEEIQLSVLPNVSLKPSYLQTFIDNNINGYSMMVEQSDRISSSNNLYLEEYDLPTSMHIPHLIRLTSGATVAVTFGSSLKKPENLIISADRLVDQRLIPSLIQALDKANEEVRIESIHISATTNGHDGKQYANSNHRKENGARAIDISRINGRNIVDLGANSPLVIALQNALNEVLIVRENFGPYLRHKDRKPYTTSRLRENHKNHIHFSINR
jgi:hypothetical protein